jgi:hypothetical protein
MWIIGVVFLESTEWTKSMVIGKVAAPRRETIAAFVTPCGDKAQIQRNGRQIPLV